MEYFILLVLVTCPLVFITERRTNQRNLIIPILGMMLLCGLRASFVGQDTDNYIEIYKWGSSRGMEPLFSLTVDLCKILDFGCHFFLFVCSVLTYVPLYKYIKKKSVNPCLSALLYMVFSVFFFLNSFNVVRMMIAASFLLLALSYLEKSENKKFTFYVLIATGFHYSSILVLPFFFLVKYIGNLKFRTVFLSVLSSFVIGFTMSSFTDFFQYLGGLLLATSLSNADYYTHYLFEYQETTMNLVGVLSLMIPPSLFVVLCYDKFNQSLSYRMFFLGTLVGNIFVSVLYTYRLTAYLCLPLIVVVPYALKMSDKFKRMCLSFLILFMCSWYIYDIVSGGNTAGVIPYKFFFNE